MVSPKKLFCAMGKDWVCGCLTSQNGGDYYFQCADPASLLSTSERWLLCLSVSKLMGLFWRSM